MLPNAVIMRNKPSSLFTINDSQLFLLLLYYFNIFDC
jgi:hypothetical protein